MRKKIQVALISLPIQIFLICSVTSGQTIKYSNKAGGIAIDFPQGWVLLTEQEINPLRGVHLTEGDNGEKEEMESSKGTAIISVALNRRNDPTHTIQILADKIIEASVGKSEQDYLVNGIEYMRQQGLEVTRYTLPVKYSSANGITFYTSKMEVILSGKAHYERNFVHKRLNDFIIISGSFVDINDDGWIYEIVDSVTLN